MDKFKLLIVVGMIASFAGLWVHHNRMEAVYQMDTVSAAPQTSVDTRTTEAVQKLSAAIDILSRSPTTDELTPSLRQARDSLADARRDETFDRVIHIYRDLVMYSAIILSNELRHPIDSPSSDAVQPDWKKRAYDLQVRLSAACKGRLL